MAMVFRDDSVRLSESQKILFDLWDGLDEITPPKGSTHDGSHVAVRKYLKSKGVLGYLERSGLVSPVKVDESVKPVGSDNVSKTEVQDVDLTKFMD